MSSKDEKEKELKKAEKKAKKAAKRAEELAALKEELKNELEQHFGKDTKKAEDKKTHKKVSKSAAVSSSGLLRAEIISNQSVQDDVIELLEQEIPGIEYTIIPDVQGSGVHSKKLGNTVWPELNFCLFAYVSVENAKKVKAIVETLKSHFENEGISLFFTQAVEV